MQGEVYRITYVIYMHDASRPHNAGLRALGQAHFGYYLPKRKYLRA